MRYLKKFNENNKEFLQDIEDFAKDCFVNSMDNGFYIYVDNDDLVIDKTHYDKIHFFNYKEVKEDLLRFIELKEDSIKNVSFFLYTFQFEESPLSLLGNDPHVLNSDRINSDTKFKSIKIIFK